MLKNIINKIFNDESLKNELLNLKTKEELYNFCANHGYSSTYKNFKKELNEIPEKDLQSVVGGKLNRKVAAILGTGSALITSMGITPSNSFAYDNPGFFHIYTAGDVGDVKKEFNNLIVETKKIIDDISEFSKNNGGSFDKNISDFKNQISDLENAVKETKTYILDRTKFADIIKSIDELETIKTNAKYALDITKKLETKPVDKLQIEKEQNERFDGYKKYLIQNIENKVKQIDICMATLSKEENTFDIDATLLKNEADQLKSNLNNITMNSSLRDNDLSKFEKNIENYFSNVNNDINSFFNKIDDFVQEIAQIMKDIEQQIVAKSQDEIFAQIEDLSVQIKDQFMTVNLNEDSSKKIDSMKNSLLESLETLNQKVLSMNSLKNKKSIEKEFSLFKNRFDRDVARKNSIVEREKSLKAVEQALSDLKNPDMKFNLIYDRKLDINDVVGGYGNIKSQIRNLVEQHRRAIKTGKGIPTKGMVLHGVPGTGKTTMVKAMAAAEHSDLVILKRKTSDASSDMSEEINQKFNEAKSLYKSTNKDSQNIKPVILLIDEIDAIGSARSKNKTDKETVTLLANIDSLKPTDGVVILATTNLIDSVDPAVIRSERLESMCEVTVPSDNDIKEILRIAVSGYKLEDNMAADTFCAPFVSTFRGNTGADIQRSVELAVQSRMLKSNVDLLSQIILYRSDLKEIIE